MLICCIAATGFLICFELLVTIVIVLAWGLVSPLLWFAFFDPVIVLLVISCLQCIVPGLVP